MEDTEEPEDRSGRAETSEAELGLAIGLLLLGGTLMLMAGVFHFIVGLAAILNEEFYILHPGYSLEMDATSWGWIHLIGGVLMGVVAVFLFAGRAWAQLAALCFAMLSSGWSFYSIPYYPVWSLTIIAIDVGLIWAIVTHGQELAE